MLCWNLHHGEGADGKIDLARIAKVITDTKPDLVALQEVDRNCRRSGKVDQTAELSKLTGMKGVFGKAMPYEGGEYGQAILSRFPVLTHQVHPLPGNAEPRIAFEATIASAPNRTIRFISVHLGLEENERIAQTTAIEKQFRDLTGAAILCGDFNATSGSPPMRILQPAWQEIPGGEKLLTEPADQPKVGIDHFLTRNLARGGSVEVLPEAVASDHRPILAVLDGPSD